jgi:hypothetical protein
MRVDPLQLQHARAVKFFVTLNAFISARSTVARGQHVAHSDISNEKTFFGNFPLAQPRQNAQVSFKTYEIFIYGDIHYITNSNCKKKW